MRYLLPITLVIALAFTSCKKDLVDTSLNEIQDVTSLEMFRQDISTGVSLVFFHASWCDICAEQRPAFEESATNTDLNAVLFLEVEYDDNKDVAQEYNVPGFPQMLIFKDGVEQERLTSSGHSAEKIATTLQKYL